MPGMPCSKSPFFQEGRGIDIQATCIEQFPVLFEEGISFNNYCEIGILNCVFSY